ncbi:sensor histidine kinase [Myroides fluvii]|uniref:sensor histidine kinase n=1 Tax=Myroides fluvii TaxID=2572594 RepID=UPI00131C30FB|nr:HAMP domain-containing sensor histidine kinase [Myroides fluvii]
MKSLLNTYQRYFILYTGLLLFGCAPLFYWVMEFCYAEDLDELIEYRTHDFTQNHLPKFSIQEIDLWNRYNYDLMIVPPDTSIVVHKPQLVSFFNPAEGYEVGYRTLYTSIVIEGQPYLLLSRIAMVEPKDLLHTLIYEYGLVVLIFFLSIVLIQKLLAKKLWSPFYNTLNQIENYNLEKGNVPLFEPTQTLEFNRLNSNLQHLIENNLTVYKQQRIFIDNASHELQTPLAVFRSQLDLLLQETDLTQKQMHLVQSLYNVSSRFNRLNKNLLLLAKIENNQFQQFQCINLAELLSTQWGFFEELAAEKEIHLTQTLDATVNVKGIYTLIESLFSNLLSNAIKYSSAGGHIHLKLDHSGVQITNTGEIALDPERIFLRFNRATEEKNGTGLGLAIVREIVKLHQWEIAYSFTSYGHRFSISFEPTPIVSQ